jgi:hypothetical protein
LNNEEMVVWDVSEILSVRALLRILYVCMRTIFFIVTTLRRILVVLRSTDPKLRDCTVNLMRCGHLWQGRILRSLLQLINSVSEVNKVNR